MQGHINYVGERGGSVVDCRTPEREVGVRNLLEQDTIYSSKELVLFFNFTQRNGECRNVMHINCLLKYIQRAL